MIHVNPPARPQNFDADCKNPGQEWVNKKADLRSHPLWTQFKSELRDGFRNRCAFFAMFISEGTVDHWLSIKNRPDLAYEWTNFRYVSGTVNSAKKPKWDGRLLDPFEIDGDWFEIDLGNMRLTLVANIDAETRKRAEFTLDKLHLRDGDDIVRQRWLWYDMYVEFGNSIEWLWKVAPLIAKAVAKRDGLVIGETSNNAPQEPTG